MATALLSAPSDTWSDEPLFEIVDGVRVELPMSAENVLLANQLSQEIAGFARPKGLGRSVAEVPFELPLPDRSRDRRPDAASVSFKRWPRTRLIPSEGNAWPVVPDLAAKFAGPYGNADELIDKTRDYLDAGVECVWLVYTHHRCVLEFESLTRVRGIMDTDELEGKDFLPDFLIPVASLF